MVVHMDVHKSVDQALHDNIQTAPHQVEVMTELLHVNIQIVLHQIEAMIELLQVELLEELEVNHEIQIEVSLRTLLNVTTRDEDQMTDDQALHVDLAVVLATTEAQEALTIEEEVLHDDLVVAMQDKHQIDLIAHEATQNDVHLADTAKNEDQPAPEANAAEQQPAAHEHNLIK